MSRHTLIKLLLPAGAVTALVLAASLQAIGASADSGGPAPSAVEGLVNYLQPTGPELSVGAIGQLAARYAAEAGDPNPTGLTAARGTFAGAQAVLDPGSPMLARPAGAKLPDGSTVPPSAATSAWLASPAYLVVMRGRFTANLPVPRGRALPGGAVYALIIDAHTGFAEARYLGPRAPDPRALGPVTEFASGGAPIATASFASRPSGGSIVGRASGGAVWRGAVRHRGASARGWRVFVVAAGDSIRSRRILASTLTDRGGRFSILIRPGRYLLDARLPNGTLCLSGRYVRVAPGQESHVELGCSLP